MGLPLEPAKLLTPRGWQVLGIGRGAVHAVLNRHNNTLAHLGLIANSADAVA
jgi:hypothetical protein